MKTNTTGLRAAAALSMLFLLLAGCENRPGTASRSEGLRFVVTAPEGSSRQKPQSAASKEPVDFGEDSQLEEAPESRVPLDADSIQLTILNDNLDVDQMDEQIIVAKGRNAEQDRIRILVIDFDTVRNGYYITWQGTTGATDSRNFSLYLKDVTGDHNLEIVCMGTDSAGFQTLDIFRKTQSPSGFGLYFISICNLAVDGTVEVLEVERSQAYELEQKNGQSFPVVAFTRDPESVNGLDLIKSTYYWKFQDNTYVLGSAEKIPSKNVQEKQLQELFKDDSVASFEKYLSGPWLLASTEMRDALSPGDIILFETDSRKITFYSKDIQEIYDWKTSRKNIFRGLSISSENESINSIQRQITIAVQSVDTIFVDINGNEQWSGTYKKLSPEVQRSLIRQPESPARLSTISLSGLYRNDKDIEMVFQSPNITIVENGKRSSGGYAVYTAGRDILELRLLKENGLVAESRTYLLEYSEEKDEAKITRIIKLTPSVVGIRGAEPLGKSSIRLEQIEILEKEAAPGKADNS